MSIVLQRDLYCMESHDIWVCKSSTYDSYCPLKGSFAAILKIHIKLMMKLMFNLIINKRKKFCGQLDRSSNITLLATLDQL